MEGNQWILLTGFPHPSAQKPPETVSEVETLNNFPGGSIHPNIIKLMNTMSLFVDGKTLEILLQFLPPLTKILNEILSRIVTISCFIHVRYNSIGAALACLISCFIVHIQCQI